MSDPVLEEGVQEWDNNSSAPTQVILTLAATPPIGNLLLLIVYSGNNVNRFPFTPSGYTKLFEASGVAGSSRFVTVFAKEANGVENSVTVNASQANTSMNCLFMNYSGADTTDLNDIMTEFIDDQTASPYDCPGIPGIGSDASVIHGMGIGGFGLVTTLSGPPGPVKVDDFNSDGTAGTVSIHTLASAFDQTLKYQYLTTWVFPVLRL